MVLQVQLGRKELLVHREFRELQDQLVLLDMRVLMVSRDQWGQQDLKELPDLKAMAIQAARACGGGVWSVDFCQDDARKFWLLDMAVAQDSYHWPGCPESV